MSFLRLFKQGPMRSSGETEQFDCKTGRAECGRIICALPSPFVRLAFANFMEFEPNASSRRLGNHNGPLSSALAGTFRGKLYDIILRNLTVTTFEKDQVIYDAADENQTFFFLQKGFVKVGSITEGGHELIYDVRKAGDIVGELCASGQQRQDRAVALERTEVIAVPLDEILKIVQTNRHLLQELLQMFCESLSDAYDQLNTLASRPATDARSARR